MLLVKPPGNFSGTNEHTKSIDFWLWTDSGGHYHTMLTYMLCHKNVLACCLPGPSDIEISVFARTCFPSI